MKKRYVVLDQNVLRKASLKSHTVEFPDAHYILPDLAFFEMTKSAEWEDTLRRSLQTLAEVPDRVFVCRAIAEALRYELVHGQSFEGRWIDHDATSFVRDLLRWARTGEAGRSITQMRATIDDHRSGMAAEYLDHSANKQGLQELIDISGPLINPALLKAMRAARANRADRICLIRQAASELAPAVLKSSGFVEADIEAFLDQRPLLLRYLYIRLWQVMHWLEFGGYENRSAEAVTNDEIDIQYVLPATFFHGLLSEEKRVIAAYSDLSDLIQS